MLETIFGVDREDMYFYRLHVCCIAVKRNQF